MEVLLWLAPAVVVTAAAMAWAGWAGRQRRESVDRDEAVRRLGAALERQARSPGYAVPAEPSRTTERSTGVAVRRSSTRATTTPSPAAEPAAKTPAEAPAETPAETPAQAAAEPPVTPRTPPADDQRPHRQAS